MSHLSATPHLSLLLLNRSSTEAELEPKPLGALLLLTYLLMSDQLSENFRQVRKCTAISKVTHGVLEPISVFTLSWARSKANQQLSWSVKIGVKGQNEQQGFVRSPS